MNYEEEYKEPRGYCGGCFGVELDETDHDATLEEIMGEKNPTKSTLLQNFQDFFLR